ncbi:AMP-binding protein [Brevundimonas sp. VNH65]|uniref:AMP-binding protein n=1 Tax=Brevundimonas sp. VNH65 TaxID=3400917 RepID=UPI003C1094B2
MNVGVIGSCLSNLPAALLMADYGWTRLNNSAAQRSDLFVSQVIEGREPPPLPLVQELFGVDPAADDANRFLRENYRHLCGMTEIEPSRPGLWANLHQAKFDLLLLDNLNDLSAEIVRYKGAACDPFDIFFPLHLIDVHAALAESIEVGTPLTPQQSADNWIEITRFVKALQPRARIIFSSAPYCTAIGDPGRYERAIGFHDLFVDRASAMGVEVLPPTNLPVSLTRLPDDRNHFDMSVYRALAGHMHMSVLSGWSNWTNKPLPREVVEAEVDHSCTPSPQVAEAVSDSDKSLLPVVAAAIGAPAEEIGEDAAMNRTEKWDSLKQIGVVLAVEEAFDVKLPFEATTEAVNVPALRRFLLEVGVRAADHVDAAEAPDKADRPPAVSAPDAPRDSLGPRLVAAPVDWGGADSGRNLFADFLARARSHPRAPYLLLVHGKERRVISNGEVLADALSVAARLTHLPRGAVVALVLDHSAHLYSGFIGCILAGLTPTILAPRTPRQDASVFQDSMSVLFRRIRPAAVLTGGAAADSVPSGDFDLVDMARLAPADADEVAGFAPPSPTEGFGEVVAFLQHSSGTTGHKKGVMLTHTQVLEQVRLYSAAIGLEAGDRIASWLPLYHDMGLITSFILPTIMGCPIISLDAQEWVVRPGLLLDLIESEQAQYCWLPNFAFLHIVRNDRTRGRNLGSMRMFVNCSEPCRAAAFDAFLERYAEAGITPDRLQVSYAMAENVFAVTQTEAGQVTRRLADDGAEYLSSGRPLQGAAVEIRDPDGWPVPLGQLGEIWLRSSCLFGGYHRLPELTSKRLIDGWYRTGDLGRLNDGELFVVGRTDDLILVNGRNIVAHEVEDQIAAVPGVAPGRVLVAGEFDDEVGTSRIIVLAESLPDDVLDEAAMSAAIGEMVFGSTGVTPATIRLLPRGYLVKSSSGKLARRASLNKFANDGMSLVEAEA